MVMAISNGGHLLISASVISISFLRATWEGIRRQCVWGKRAIYLCLGVKNAPCDFTDGGNIPDGDRTLSGVTSISNNCEGEIRDIYCAAYGGANGRTVNGRRRIRIAIRIVGINADCSNCMA